MKTKRLPAAAGELCLEREGGGAVFRLNCVQQESVFAVNGLLQTAIEEIPTAGTAFLRRDGSLVIALTMTYPDEYTHPQCTDMFTFAPGKFRTASLEGSCFGSTTEANKQYTFSHKRTACP